jgi:hypothetical protein
MPALQCTIVMIRGHHGLLLMELDLVTMYLLFISLQALLTLGDQIHHLVGSNKPLNIKVNQLVSLSLTSSAIMVFVNIPHSSTAAIKVQELAPW